MIGMVIKRSGIGKDGKRGIATPVEAKMRPKGLGMGFGRKEQPSDPKSKVNQTEEDDVEVMQDDTQIRGRRNWKAGRRKIKVFIGHLSTD